MSRAIRLSCLHWWFLRLINDVMFVCAWPLAARLPFGAGMKLAEWLGRLCYVLDLDWRTVAVREHFVRDRSRSALAEICPSREASAIERLLVGRFITAAREELEGHWLHQGRAEHCRCEFEGLDAIKAQVAASGQGVVLLAHHFDAVEMGIAQMGLAGLKVNLMSSNIVEDTRVPLSVQRYFRLKYAGLSRYLNGGSTVHVEPHMSTRLQEFYARLSRGECLVVLGEAPSNKPDKAVIVDFLGRRRAMAPGAVRIAEQAGVPMAAFVCLSLSCGSYRVICTPLFFPSSAGSHAGNVPALFAFLEAHIRHHPDRWWAADLMHSYLNLD